VTVGKLVAGLEPGTAYHHRLVVTTNAGTTIASDVEFATDSPPPEPEPVSVPAPPPPAPLVVLPPSPPPAVKPLPRCKKGFRRQRVGGKPRCVRVCKKRFRQKRVRGKVRCVKVKRWRKHRRRASGGRRK
jgi:hypothetical protein